MSQDSQAMSATVVLWDCRQMPMQALVCIDCYQQKNALECTPKSSIYNILDHKILEGSSETSSQNKQYDSTVELCEAATMTHVPGHLTDSLVSSHAQPAPAHGAADAASPPPPSPRIPLRRRAAEAPCPAPRGYLVRLPVLRCYHHNSTQPWDTRLTKMDPALSHLSRNRWRIQFRIKYHEIDSLGSEEKQFLSLDVILWQRTLRFLCT